MIRDKEVVVGIEGKPRGPLQLAGSRAVLAPSLQILPILVEDGDLVCVLVGQVQAILAVNGEGRGPKEVPLRRALASELAEPLVIQAHHPDADGGPL